MQRAVEQGGAAPVVVVDGLDEARGQAFAIAAELLLRLAPYAVVIVATRELTGAAPARRCWTCLPLSPDLDLDAPAAQGRGRADMRAYIAGRLAGVDPRMDPDAIAEQLAGATSIGVEW